ncbi:putative dehydrogenase [Cytobacillus eiseniae]|uniref:Dehydrogenase n=1 Tax=Cytobacillus eiseniae TaxID=762947 RepID=A0ABS4RBI7_9BACI|nr:Gfo/Idh/MocA family oxidoreductase [Cytobacillus eiseniae]MBP2240260.1 putative dehydrogenase [Cytobacillus eiseniae]
MDKIKWGILGTAKIAMEQVIPAIQRSSNGVVAAIASSSGKAVKIASQFNIPHSYESYEDLLADPEIDAVYIPLPNHLHKEWAIKAANARKHVLCEKPAALNTEDVKAMVSACMANDVLFMEGFMYRFHPQHTKVKELIQDNVIGDIKMLHANFSFYMEDRKGNIRLNRQLGGGVIYDIGCYCIHSLRYILEAEPIQMSVIGEMNDEGVDTSASVIMTFPNNVQAMFMCSFDAMLKNEYEIIGSKGSIRVPFAYRPDLNAGKGIVQLVLENEFREYVIDGDQYKFEVEHFADCIQSNREPVSSGDHAISNMRVIDALLEMLI